MAMNVRSALIVFAAGALCAGCEESLFDAGGRAGDAGPGSDGAASPVSDGAPAGRDAGLPPLVCPPESCEGDAAAEFSDSQGGSTGRWVYLQDRDTALGVNFNPLVWDESEGPGMWRGPGIEDRLPSIERCSEASAPGACAGRSDGLLFTGASERFHPMLGWRAERAGAYRVFGDWVVDDVAQAPGAVIRLTRNGNFDTLLRQDAAGEPEVAAAQGSFDVRVDLAEDDILRLTLIPGAVEASASLRLFISLESEEVSCQAVLLLDREREGGFANECARTAGAADSEWRISPMAPSEQALPEGAAFGPTKMREFFDQITVQRIAKPRLNYSGDWTIQFWAQVEIGRQGATPRRGILSDWQCDDASRGGVEVVVQDGDRLLFSVAHGGLDVSDGCAQGPRIALDLDEDGGLHFYRLVRDSAAEELRLCRDGALVGREALPGGDVMSTAAPFSVGTTSADPTFIGNLADLRIYAEALPCGDE